tara:strand:+ start:223 stop:450 length:228 start_codon:yes stop_codon:yes gene_type:complete
MTLLNLRAIILMALFFCQIFTFAQLNEKIRIGLTADDEEGLEVLGPTVGIVFYTYESSQQILTLTGFDFDRNNQD